VRIMDLFESIMELLREDKNAEYDQVILEDKNTAGLLTKQEFMRAVGTLIARISELIAETHDTLELL
jgi:hypothetical protein